MMAAISVNRSIKYIYDLPILGIRCFSWEVFTHLCAFFALVTGVSAWKCAKYRHYFSQQPDYIDCFWDCCGNSFNRHCCAPIGMIVGCSIVGAVVVAAVTVLFICWWQRRRARKTKGPKLFHNRRHSHYPVAPTSVTRPAPNLGGQPVYTQRAGYPPYPGDRPPPQRGFAPRPHPQQGYGPPQQQGYGPRPQQGYGPPPQQGYRPPPEQPYDSDREKMMYRDMPPSSDFDSDRERGPPRQAPPLQEKQPPRDEFFM